MAQSSPLSEPTSDYLRRGFHYRAPIVDRFTVGSSGGVEVAVQDLGGDGPPLVFAHATGFCGPAYGPVAEALADRFHCWSFDFRSHGASSRPEGELVWSGMADDVVAVIRAISPDEPVYAIGHSMGGAALVLAQRDHNELLRAGWAFEPILFPDLGPVRHPSFMSDNARKRRSRFPSRDDAYERYGSRPPLNLFDPRCLRAYVDNGFRNVDDGAVGAEAAGAGEVELACRPEDEASVFEFHNSGALEALGELTVPFGLAASGDGGRPAEAVIAAAEQYPAADLFRFEDLNHFGPLQAPESMAYAAADYLLGASR